MRSENNFETERLILRPLDKATDSESLYQLLGDKETVQALGGLFMNNAVETGYLIEGHNYRLNPEEMGYAMYGYFEKESGRFVGFIQVYPDGDDIFHKKKLGYAAVKEFRGQGYTPEAVKGMTEFLMENQEELDEITISFFTWNESSCHAASKSGYIFKEITQHSYRTEFGILEDEEHWSYLREDYLFRRSTTMS